MPVGLGQFDIWRLEPDNYNFQPGQYDDWWQRYVYDSTQRGLDILGARYGQGQYASPDDPRYRQGSGGYLPPGGGAHPGYGLSPGGLTGQGFQINWWAAALIGVVVGAFVLGRRR
jgi:hypothetical protein